MPLRLEYSDGKNYSAPPTSASGPALSESLVVKNTAGTVLFTITDDGRGNVSISTVGSLAVSGSITQAGLSLTAAFVYKGAIDCLSNPNWPAANAGDVYKVSVAGKIGGASGQVVQAGDVLTCNVSGVAGTDAGVGANWMIQQGNVVSTADVPASANKNYITDAQLTTLGNLSGVTPFADGTYTVGLGVNSNGSITISKGLITAVVEAS